MTDLSEQQVLDCTPNPKHCGGTGGCHGGTIELAYDKIIEMGGLSTEWMYPYTSYFGDDNKCHYDAGKTRPFTKMSKYVVLPTNKYEPVLETLATKGPLGVAVDASTWKSYSTGVFDGCNQTHPILNHVVQLVGYGTDAQHGDYWLVRNSWSPSWGENGYIRLKRKSTPECGWNLKPGHGNGCDGGPEKEWVCGTCGVLFDSVYPLF